MENKEQKHTQGKPWKIEARFKTYKEAEDFCSDLKKTEKPPEQIKIKHMASNGLFVVKTRNSKDKKTKNKK